MDQQLFDVMMNRFDQSDRNFERMTNEQNEKLDKIVDTLERHVKKDEVYWKKIDVAEGQITLIKGVGGSSVLTAVGAWLWQKFVH